MGGKIWDTDADLRTITTEGTQMNDETQSIAPTIKKSKHNKLSQITMLIVALTILVATIYIPTVYMIQSHETIITTSLVKLTDKGVDPIAARCALAESDDQLCILFVASKKESKLN